MRTIKRYSNRKLYDTEGKRYITLEGIAELIRQGEDVAVIENDTGEDLTAVTLSQIIFEQQKRGSHAPLGFLTNLIRFDSATPLELLRRSLALPASALLTIEKEIERRLQEVVEQGEMAEEQMRRLQADLMGRFHEGRGRERGRDDTLDAAELAQRIDALNARLDELIGLARTAPPPAPEPPRAAAEPDRSSDSD